MFRQEGWRVALLWREFRLRRRLGQWLEAQLFRHADWRPYKGIADPAKGHRRRGRVLVPVWAHLHRATGRAILHHRRRWQELCWAVRASPSRAMPASPHRCRSAVCAGPRIDRHAPPDLRPQIAFTGFGAALRTDLEARSEAAGLRVVKSVTQSLVFLCTGPNAGALKFAKARAQGVYVLPQDHLPALLESGELPDSAVDEVANLVR